LEMGTPMTTVEVLLPAFDVVVECFFVDDLVDDLLDALVSELAVALPRACFGAGSAISTSAASAGASVTISRADLSVLRPLNAAGRMLPPPVQPANWISATSLGSTQCMSAPLRGAVLPAKGFWSVSSCVSLGHRSRSRAPPKPVPTRPTYTRWPSRFT